MVFYLCFCNRRPCNANYNEKYPLVFIVLNEGNVNYMRFYLYLMVIFRIT